MRLSEAIALGRVLLTPIPGNYFSGDNSGCALGMGLAGVGCKSRDTAVIEKDLDKHWSWMNNRIPSLPCGCVSTNFDIATNIVHLFDEHVCGNKDWTLDQLIDWVRSVEPAEPEIESDAIPRESVREQGVMK